MRKHDTGWRDSMLGVWHNRHGFTVPAPGMVLPMVEYDKGEPLALISYLNRTDELPRGEEVAQAYHAFGQLHRATGEQLPFMSAQYDRRNWAMRVFGHNTAAHDFLGTRDWVTMSEQQFSDNLYRLRGRFVPDLAPYGVTFRKDGWISTEPSPDAEREVWPGAFMSQRRRNYEPGVQVRLTWRNPCTDVDFAVVDGTGSVALVVDYKAPGARTNLSSSNVAALSTLHTNTGGGQWNVPTMVVKYQPTRPKWAFAVHCANREAFQLMAYVLAPSEDDETTARVIANAEWVELTEAQWLSVLRCAQNL